MQRLSRFAYGLLRRVPAPVIARVQRVASRNSRTSRLLRRISGVVRAGEHQVASGPAAGLRMNVGDSRPSYLLGTAEQEVQEFIAEHLQRGGVFYDLGANVGYFTLVGASLVGKEGRVRAYEPFPDNAELLRHNVAANGLVQVEVVEAAVSDSAGQASFEVGPTSQDGRLGEGGVTVRTQRVDDDVAAGAPVPTLVKIDVEGAELAALTGMRETLERHRPTVLCELHERPFDLDAHPVAGLLRELGYRLAWLEEGVEDGKHWAPHLVAVAEAPAA
jgi:FkbM family methyltransferase